MVKESIIWVRVFQIVGFIYIFQAFTAAGFVERLFLSCQNSSSVCSFFFNGFNQVNVTREQAEDRQSSEMKSSACEDTSGRENRARAQTSGADASTLLLRTDKRKKL